MALYQIGELLEPEGGHSGEHPTLVHDGFSHHDVKGRDAVRGDHQQTVVTSVVDVSHLPRVEMGKWDLGGHVTPVGARI